MKVRKMLWVLLAVVMVGVVAPASASATETWWYDHKEKQWPTKATPKAVNPSASLSLTVGTTQLGPCAYAFGGSIWNEVGGMGEGILTGNPIAKNCPTSLAGCTVLESTVKSSLSLTLMTSKKVRVSGVNIELHLSPGCAPLTPTTIATGTVEGAFVDAVNLGGENWAPSTVKFSKAEGLALGGKGGATLDGYIQFGTMLTALPEP